MRLSARLLAPLALLGLLGASGTPARAQVFGGGPPISNFRNWTSAFIGGGEIDSAFYGVGEFDGPPSATYDYTDEWTGDGASLGLASDTIIGRVTGSARSSFHAIGASMQASLTNPYFVEVSPPGTEQNPNLSPPRYYNAAVGAHWQDTVQVFARGFSGSNYTMTFLFAIEGTENTANVDRSGALINFRYGNEPTDVFYTASTDLQIWRVSHPVSLLTQYTIENHLWVDWTVDLARPEWEVLDGDGKVIGYAPGHDLGAVVDFGGTMTLTGVELLDPLGNPIEDFDLVSANGVLFRGGIGAAAEVPEPGTLALAGAGLLPLLGLVRRRTLG